MIVRSEEFRSIANAYRHSPVKIVHMPSSELSVLLCSKTGIAQLVYYEDTGMIQITNVLAKAKQKVYY